MNNQPVQHRAALAALRRFGQPATSTARSTPAERCDMCNLELAEEHQHLVEPNERRLVCACDACALLFCYDGTTRYRRVPRDTWRLPDFSLAEGQWDALNIPIGLVFFFQSSVSNQILAIYPSPAGPTESTIDQAPWQRLVQHNPALGGMYPDTQALLINRLHNASEHYLAPIDKCYALVGLIRANWEGFTGGDRAREALDAFFARLRARARVPQSAKKEARS